MFKLKIKPLARRDLLEIWQYTYEAWGASQADSYLVSLETSLSDLISNPKLGRAIDDVRNNMRLHPFKHHLIIYQITDTSIEVVRVLHKRMDVKRKMVI